jgi:hypothetical protein
MQIRVLMSWVASSGRIDGADCLARFYCRCTEYVVRIRHRCTAAVPSCQHSVEPGYLNRLFSSCPAALITVIEESILSR